MKLDRFGGWLALAANLGVVAGLILLALELRQNTQVVKAQSVTNLFMGMAAGETAFMGEDTAAAYVKALDSPETLTDEEISIVWAYLNVRMWSVQQAYSMHTLGLASDETWQTAKSWAFVSINFPFGQVWWDEVKFIYPSDMVEEIDRDSANADPHLEEGRIVERIVERLKDGVMESPAN